MVNIVERNDVNLVCLHCKTDLADIFTQKFYGFFGKRYIYFCPNCKAVLGVSHRKGFWMG